MSEQDAVNFVTDAQLAVRLFQGSPGCESAELVRSLDDPSLWAMLSRWSDVGSYRRAFGPLEAKLALIPLLSRAIDESSAYDSPAEVGKNLPRGTVG